MHSASSTSSTAVREVQVDRLAHTLDSGEPVIDVREPAEYVAGHGPGSTAMPMSQLASCLGALDPTGPLHVICASGNRSAATLETRAPRVV